MRSAAVPSPILQSPLLQSLLLQSLTLHLANSATMQHETIQRETQALRRRVAGSAVKRMTARGSALETISQDPRAAADTFRVSCWHVAGLPTARRVASTPSCAARQHA